MWIDSICINLAQANISTNLHKSFRFFFFFLFFSCVSPFSTKLFSKVSQLKYQNFLFKLWHVTFSIVSICVCFRFKRLLMISVTDSTFTSMFVHHVLLAGTFILYYNSLWPHFILSTLKFMLHTNNNMHHEIYRLIYIIGTFFNGLNFKLFLDLLCFRYLFSGYSVWSSRY